MGEAFRSNLRAGWVVLALVAVAGFAFALSAATAERAGAGLTSGELTSARGHLTAMAGHIEKADKRDPLSNGFLVETKDAVDDKHEFIDAAFKPFSISGCSYASVIISFDRIDVDLAEAAASSAPHKRAKDIRHAAKVAEDLDEYTSECDEDGEGVADPASAISAKLDGLEAAKSVSNAQLKKDAREIHAMKLEVFADRQVYSCSVEEIFIAIERIDVSLEVLDEISEKNGLSEKQVERKREQLLDRAAEAAQVLVKRYEIIPCGGTQEPPGGGGTQAVCSNGADDDGDGTNDFPADFGCLSAADISEKDVFWPFSCPPDGGSNTNFLDFHNGAGTGTGYQIRDSAGGAIVHSTSSASHGPTPLSGTGPCGAASYEISAGFGAAAPAVTGFPPPDGETLRIVIETTDPPGGGSGASPQLQAGVGSQ